MDYSFPGYQACRQMWLQSGRLMSETWYRNRNVPPCAIGEGLCSDALEHRQASERLPINAKHHTPGAATSNDDDALYLGSKVTGAPPVEQKLPEPAQKGKRFKENHFY